jgi:hypothetical protein
MALVRRHDQPGGGQLPHDAPDAGGIQVVHGARQRPGHPHDPAARAGGDLQAHPGPAVPAGAERPAGGDPADGHQRAAGHHLRMPGPRRVRQPTAQPRAAGGQQAHGLGDISPGGSGADAEPGRQPGERLALAQAGQHQQRLPPAGQLAPA